MGSIGVLGGKSKMNTGDQNIQSNLGQATGATSERGAVQSMSMNMNVASATASSASAGTLRDPKRMDPKRYAEMTAPLPGKSFLSDVYHYAARVKYFSKLDWQVYVAWVGLMMGLLFTTAGFTLFGAANGVQYPAYVWNVPLGTFIFVVAIAFDTIGHRTAYREELQKGESLVHGITIFAGITSCLMLCLAYTFPEFMMIPTAVFIAISIFYSMIDEVLHWRRYFELYSDRVEMWAHFFIFLGHGIFVFSWWHWYREGYPGVRETLAALGYAG
jgi:hypothetical protein